MKITVNEKPEITEENYPCIGVNKIGQHVLFTNRRTGTLLIDTLDTHIKHSGYHSDEWNGDEFQAFSGEIVLSNG